MAKSLETGKAKDDREVYLALSQINSRLKRWPDAEAAATEAEKRSNTTEDRRYVAFVQGSIYERQKKFDLAEEKFRRVLSEDPQDAMALNYLGYMLADRGVRALCLGERDGGGAGGVPPGCRQPGLDEQRREPGRRRLRRGLGVADAGRERVPIRPAIVHCGRRPCGQGVPRGREVVAIGRRGTERRHRVAHPVEALPRRP